MKKWKKPQVVVIDKDKLDKTLKELKSGCPGKPGCKNK